MQYIDNNYFMHQALIEAYKAFDCDEVPIGAVVVDQHGSIIGRGCNRVESKKSQTAHAECEAINQASHFLDDWRLEYCTLFVTLEPCAMCMNLIILSRIVHVVYGASSPLFGWRHDQQAVLQFYKLSKLTITQGILNQEIERLMKNFFITKRNVYDSHKK